jgi:uncharacterized protein
MLLIIFKNCYFNFPQFLCWAHVKAERQHFCRSLAHGWSTFDLERDADRLLIARDPEHFLLQNPEKVFIDEAQLLPELFSSMRVVIDRDRRQTGRFLLTGLSFPELLSSVAESLAGRVGIVELGTLKASERFGLPLSSLYEAIKDDLTTTSLLQLKGALTAHQLEQSFFEGGYPEPVLYSGQKDRDEWFHSYLATYVERDLRRLFPRLNMQNYKLFLSMLAQLQGKLINMSDIARALGTSQPTVREYLEIAHGTFFWRRIESFFRNSMRRVVKMPKGFFRDSGVVNFLLFLSSIRLLRASPMVGWLWEAAIIEELLKGLELSRVRYSPFFYRTSDGREVDLVLEGAFGLLPIEIK